MKTGRARMIAPYVLTRTVVVNGSVTPKVSSWSWSDGSGPAASSSSRWFCQKQRASDTPNTAAQTISRLRSSSRCSTRVRRSPLAIARGRLIAISAPSGPVVALAADRPAELADPFAHRAAELREAFRPEDDEGDDQDDDDLEWSDVWHVGPNGG